MRNPKEQPHENFQSRPIMKVSTDHYKVLDIFSNHESPGIILNSKFYNVLTPYLIKMAKQAFLILFRHISSNEIN